MNFTSAANTKHRFRYSELSYERIIKETICIISENPTNEPPQF